MYSLFVKKRPGIRQCQYLLKNWLHKSNCKFYSLPRYYTFYISPTFIHRFLICTSIKFKSKGQCMIESLCRYTVYDLSLNDRHWESHCRVLEYECEYKKVQCYHYNQSIFEVLFNNILLTIKTEKNEDYTWACLTPSYLITLACCCLLNVI